MGIKAYYYETFINQLIRQLYQSRHFDLNKKNLEVVFEAKRAQKFLECKLMKCLRISLLQNYLRMDVIPNF